MEEDQDNADRYHKTDGEQPSLEESGLQDASIGKLMLHQLTIDKPAHHNTRQEGASWQHQLSREEIAEVHQRHAKELESEQKMVITAQTTVRTHAAR